MIDVKDEICMVNTWARFQNNPTKTRESKNFSGAHIESELSVGFVW